jgi:hypothetical protein
MSDIKKKITFENRTYNLGKNSKVRVKADVAHKSAGQQVPVVDIGGTAYSGSWSTIYSSSRAASSPSTAAAQAATIHQGNEHPSSSQWTYTIKPEDSGKVFLMDASKNPLVIDLPSVGDAVGFQSSFFVKTGSQFSIEWDFQSDVAKVSGTSYTAAGADQQHHTATDRFIVLSGSAQQAPVNFTYHGHSGAATGVGAGQSVVGDELHVYNNGTNYIVKGHSNQQHATSAWSGSSTNGAA